MEAYYALQGLYNHHFVDGKLIECQTSEEKNEERLRWRSIVAEILPASFRFSKDMPTDLQLKLEKDLHDMLAEAQSEMDSTSMMKVLGFLPHSYQMTLDRAVIRKNPALSKVHEWLKEHTSCGHITRQETVSMIPPVVLNPSPTDTVLDMCAAPGSKTSQLLEYLGPDGSRTLDVVEQPSCTPRLSYSPAVIANDSNPQRAYMLSNQLRRILHHNPVAVVTACDAQFFPNVTQFDRILADVPCSGDGTTRKNISVWKQWSQMGALTLHSLQLDIAWKGAEQLLRVGGHMVYSTCSLNPIENEAVVAELLRKAGGQLELVAVTLEDFLVRPGWNSWKVVCGEKSRREMRKEYRKHNPKMQQRRKEYEESQAKLNDESGGDATTKGDAESKDDDESNVVEEADTIENKEETKETDPATELSDDIAQTSKKFEPASMDDDSLMQLALEAGFEFYESVDEVPEKMKARVKSSCFPPTTEEVGSFHLERCIRCMPHDNNTGGFFVALLRKKGPLSAFDRRSAGESPASKRVKLESKDDSEEGEGATDNNDASFEKPTKPKNRRRGRGATPDQEDFVSIDASVLDPLIDYYGLEGPDFRSDLFMARTNGAAKNISYIVPSVKSLFDMGLQDRVNMINSGVKVFVKNNQECKIPYRVAQEGVHFLTRFMTKRKISVSMEDFTTCLQKTAETIAMESFSENFRKLVRPMDVGSFVAVLEGYEDDHEHKMLLTLWRCRGDHVNVLVSAPEIATINGKLRLINEKK